jgi:hypothetical protein
MRVQIVLKNISTREISFVRLNPEYEYQITVLDENGKPVPDTALGQKLKDHATVTGGGGPLWTLKPGDTLKDHVVVNDLYDISTPGKYSVSVERKLPEELGVGTVKSNVITVTVE